MEELEQHPNFNPSIKLDRSELENVAKKPTAIASPGSSPVKQKVSEENDDFGFNLFQEEAAIEEKPKPQSRY